MAHKKAGGSTRNGRDSESKRLGVIRCGGAAVSAGNIIVRQGVTHFHPGPKVGLGRYHTLFATAEGEVRFDRKGPKKPSRGHGGRERLGSRRQARAKDPVRDGVFCACNRRPERTLAP